MKKIISLLLTIILAATFTGCQSNKSGATKLRLLTSFYPIYIMTLNIVDGVDGVEVESLANQEVGCLHDFQLQTDDMKHLEQADAFIINGAGMESFLDKVTNEIPGLTMIDSSYGIELLKNQFDEHDHEDEDSEHSEYNAHTWVSVTDCIQQVKNISDGIIALDPQNADKYTQNTQTYISKLEELRSDMNNGLKNISTRDIITFHEAFPYFAKEFNLNVVKVINREPNTEPNAKELAETIELINATNVKALFVEPQYSKTAADTIAHETHANVYTLDPVVSGEDNKDAYINTMRKNLEVLKEALK